VELDTGMALHTGNGPASSNTKMDAASNRLVGSGAWSPDREFGWRTWLYSSHKMTLCKGGSPSSIVRCGTLSGRLLICFCKTL
jgi:hypothetical protein